MLRQAANPTSTLSGTVAGKLVREQTLKAPSRAPKETRTVEQVEADLDNGIVGGVRRRPLSWLKGKRQ